MWFMRMKELAVLGVRVVAGTAVYAIIVLLAASLPAAAGLMLTFPALNGLAFFFSEDERAASIAKSMLWMPAINGVLCAGYISLFAFVATVRSATLVAWCLVALNVALWLACVSRQRVRKGVAQEHQLAFVVAVTVIGVVLAAGGAFEATYLPVAELPGQPAPGTDGAGWIAAALGRSQLKIGLFALALIVFFSSIAYLPISDSTRGILSGLLLVPIGGLVAIAADAGMSLDERLRIFRAMMGSAWLGPAVAAWFIYFFSRFSSTRARLRTPLADDVIRFAALLAGWGVTFGVIVAIARVINWLSA
jgi:putative effector of murein hydrolase LrgA (UPF0299 family)